MDKGQGRGWVLISGCSTGIGRALAQACRAQGWGVVATARDTARLEDLPEGPDLRRLPLDVNDAASVQAALEACGDLRLVALVNNAGYGQMGPLEHLRPEELRAQFETNVVGLHRLTAAAIPVIRKNARPGEGLVVHIASVLGRVNIPMAGAYNASKHAVVALGESLRMELAPAIRVMLVEPGAIRSEFRSTLMKAWGDLPRRLEGTPYRAALEQYRTQRERFAQEHGLDAEACALRIARAMSRRRPPRRLVVGADAFWAQVASRVLPAWLWERTLRRMYGLE